MNMEGKHYHITYQDKDTQEKNIKLYKEVEDNGKCIKSEWAGDYLVGIFEYNNKIYELWDNMELGIMSEVIEFDKEEYLNDQTISNNS